MKAVNKQPETENTTENGKEKEKNGTSSQHYVIGSSLAACCLLILNVLVTDDNDGDAGDGRYDVGRGHFAGCGEGDQEES